VVRPNSASGSAETVEDAMARSPYELALGTTVIDAARTALGEQLPRHLPALQEPPAEIGQLLARLAAIDSVERRTAERQAAASLPLQLPAWPRS
jgi:hypothetical protein